MDELDKIEQTLALQLPGNYKRFLLEANNFVIENDTYCRILTDNYRTDGVVTEFYSTENFLERQQYRDDLIEDQNHFENPDSYVEAKHLYYIAEGSGSICIALGGQHYGKIYSVDNGDFGIIYQAENIDDFLQSLYNPSKFRCTDEELIDSVQQNNLDRLVELVEKKIDGNKRIEYCSFLDITLFDLAYKNGFDHILKYLISKGYKGHNRVEHYNFHS